MAERDTSGGQSQRGRAEEEVEEVSTEGTFHQLQLESRAS